MTSLLTAAQMRAIEAAAIASGKVTGLALMERAGAGVVAAIWQEWPELQASPGRAVVLCGPGNNGGDGFVVARRLADCGWTVEVYFYGQAERLPPDARVNHDLWAAMGAVIPWDDAAQKHRFEEGEDIHLVVDALFGTGLTRLMPEDTELTWRGLMGGPLPQNAHAPHMTRFVAVDLPSGICSDSGKDLGAWPAHLTVTFHQPKVGHYMVENCLNYGGAYGCHKLAVVDIGLETPMSQGFAGLASPATYRLSKSHGHKFSHGHALVVSGPPGQGGAARLAARAALRSGAGLVTLACPPQAMAENAAHLTAVMLKPLADGAALTEILQDRRITALCLGPGLGLDASAADVLRAALTASETRRLVLDADALTLIARDPSLFAALHPGCILTPHGGEFARLFPDLAAEFAAPAQRGPAFSKLDATRAAAARANCLVLYKGADTVIVDPKGHSALSAAVYDRAAPWLATAGSGDVLAGLITGLLARGLSPFIAAQTAAWLHVEAARSFGPGLIAEDLPEELPKVFRALGL